MSDDREYVIDMLGDWAHHPYKVTCTAPGKVIPPAFFGKHADAEQAGRTWVATGVSPANQTA